MPELPDVAVFKKYIDSTSLHKRIRNVEVETREILKNISPRTLKSHLIGQKFKSSRRHGKYLFVTLTGGEWLVIHFGMTGFLKYFKDHDKEPGHARMLIEFKNGYHLAYDCQRKLGMITLADNEEEFIAEKSLGPDAMDAAFDLAAFRERLSGKSGMTKTTLMNQKIIAGIGNVYSDEILFQAGLHPKTPVKHLSDKDLRNLYRRMKKVLRTTTARDADPERLPAPYLTRHREKGAACPRCGSIIKTLTVSGRTAYFCPDCQKNR